MSSHDLSLGNAVVRPAGLESAGPSQSRMVYLPLCLLLGDMRVVHDR